VGKRIDITIYCTCGATEVRNVYASGRRPERCLACHRAARSAASKKWRTTPKHQADLAAAERAAEQEAEDAMRDAMYAAEIRSAQMRLECELMGIWIQAKRLTRDLGVAA
jgi:hypothetical protein